MDDGHLPAKVDIVTCCKGWMEKSGFDMAKTTLRV